MAAQLSTKDLVSLQEQQRKHDAAFHRDVYSLPRQARLRHLVFHFAKYTGRLSECRSINDRVFERTLVDSFIIALSATHVLGMVRQDLASAVALRDAEKHGVNDVVAYFRDRLARETGRMAKACEGLDHLEKLDYVGMHRTAVNAILSASMNAACVMRMDLRVRTRRRWQQVEAAWLP